MSNIHDITQSLCWPHTARAELPYVRLGSFEHFPHFAHFLGHQNLPNLQPPGQVLRHFLLQPLLRLHVPALLHEVFGQNLVLFYNLFIEAFLTQRSVLDGYLVRIQCHLSLVDELSLRYLPEPLQEMFILLFNLVIVLS